MTALLAPPIAGEAHQLKARLKSMWMTGDYARFARFMEADAKLFYHRLEVSPGSSLLDVGCGTGQLSLIAARAGAHVSGCDIATNWLKQARTRSFAEVLPIEFKEEDAECLPYPDSRFDVVASLFGAMYAPHLELAADELQRVCKPGGQIAMANWTSDGLIGQMFQIIVRYTRATSMPSPLLWAMNQPSPSDSAAE